MCFKKLFLAGWPGHRALPSPHASCVHMSTDAGDAGQAGQAGRVKASLSRLSLVFLGSCLAQCCATTKHLGFTECLCRPIRDQGSAAWTNQRREIGLRCPDETLMIPPGPPGCRVSRFGWLICPLARQSPLPCP